MVGDLEEEMADGCGHVSDIAAVTVMRCVSG